MKITSNFVKRKVAGEIVLVPVGEQAQYFNGLITPNRVAGFILDHLDECQTPDDMIQKVLDAFMIDEDTARRDTLGFLAALKQAGIIED